MSKQKRTITNGSGKQITMLIDPSNTNMHIHNEVEWTLTEAQWSRIVRESDNTAWSTERGAVIRFTCAPHAADCKYPGRA